MDATAWTVIGTGVAILTAIGAAFWSMRAEMRALQVRIDAQGQNLQARIDEQGQNLQARIDEQGQKLRAQIEAQGKDLRERMNAQSEQMSLLRERMAHLEGLLEGLREAITGKRVA